MCYGSVNIGGIFVEKLRELLGNRYAKIDKLNSIEKTVYVLGSELWEYYCRFSQLSEGICCRCLGCA